MADRVVSMPRASVVEDGNLIEMEFKTESGATSVLAFSPAEFDRFIGRTNQLVLQARIDKSATTGHHEIHAQMAAAVEAQAPAGGGRVILTVHNDKGLPFRFSLAPDLIEPLRQQLFRAGKSAEKQASKPRH